MTTSAIITMVLIMGIVTAFTGYFFYKVLTISRKDKSDSHSEDDV